MRILIVFFLVALVTFCPDECFAHSWNQYKCAADAAQRSGDNAGAIRFWSDALARLSGPDDPRWCETVIALARLHAAANNRLLADRMYEKLINHAKTSGGLGSDCHEALAGYCQNLKTVNDPEKEVEVAKLLKTCHKTDSTKIDTIAFSTSAPLESSTLNESANRSFLRRQFSGGGYGASGIGSGSMLSGGYTNPNSVHVGGYSRQDGTYVPPHERSSPNETTLDNWSHRGNINPHTGRRGYQSGSGFSRSSLDSPTSHEILQSSHSHLDTPSSSQIMQTHTRMSSSPFYK